jgi:hypothetical protein
MNVYRGGHCIKPELAMKLHQMEHFYKALDLIIPAFQKYHEELAPSGALHAAFQEMHRELYGVPSPLSVDELHSGLRAQIDAAQRDLELIIESEVVPLYHRKVKTVKRVVLRHDPCRLLAIAAKPIDASQTNARKRLVLDARRNFARGLFYLAMECADPEDNIAEDMSDVEGLLNKRLYEAGGEREISVVVALKTSDYNRVDSRFAPRIFERDEDAQVCCSTMQEMGMTAHLDGPWVCRSVIVGDRRFWVDSDPDRKTKSSRFSKMQRKNDPAEIFKDNRRWRDIVVAVESSDGRLTIATRCDAEEYRKACQERLWSTVPFREEEDDGLNDPSRHKLYWDTKIVGRFFRRRETHTIGGRIEQIVTYVVNHILVTASSGFENHRMRRGRERYKHLFPVLWPDHGVAWSDPDVYSEHVALWRSKVDHFGPLK